jgi:hypothetical protein
VPGGDYLLSVGTPAPGNLTGWLPTPTRPGLHTDVVGCPLKFP